MRKYFCLLLCCVALLSACQSSYFVDTHIEKNLSGSRSCYSVDTTFSILPDASWKVTPCKNPFLVDFFSSEDTMRYQAEKSFARLDDVALSLKDFATGDESVEKHFLWFVTRYSYHAHYENSMDFPAPVSKYFSPEQQRLFFRATKTPETWNGRELYLTLDDMNGKFELWASDCCFTLFYETLMELSDSNQRVVLEQYRDTLFGKFLSCNDPSFDTIMSMVAAVPSLGFCEKLFEEELFDQRYEAYVGMMISLGSAFVHRVDLPGILSRPELPSCMEEGYAYKIDGIRLLAGPININVNSFSINVVPTLVTLLLVLALVFWVRKKRRIAA